MAAIMEVDTDSAACVPARCSTGEDVSGAGMQRQGGGEAGSRVGRGRWGWVLRRVGAFRRPRRARNRGEDRSKQVAQE